MSAIGKLDTTHAMYQRGKRKSFERAQVQQANLIQPKGNPNGSRAEREEWMRARQSVKAENGGDQYQLQKRAQGRPDRDAVAEAEDEAQARRARHREKCLCTIRQIKARIAADPELMNALRTVLERVQELERLAYVDQQQRRLFQ